VAYLLRVLLPDRPGALGAVATALGGVGGDILSVDVIERSSGHAVDDLVVELPPGKLPDTLVSAAAAVDGVSVETIRSYAGQIDPHRELELLDALASHPDDPLPLLANGVARVFRAGWVLILHPPVNGTAGVVAASVAAPQVTELATPWWPPHPARPLADLDGWAPADWVKLDTELAVAPLGPGALLLGRPAMRWLPAEMIHLNHLAGIAASVTAGLPDPRTRR
jgi:ACT domain